MPDPSYNSETLVRAANALRAFSKIYVRTPSHKKVQDEFDLLRLSNLGMNGSPMSALRLAEISSAGKTACIDNYVSHTLSEHQVKTGVKNPYLVLVMPLSTVTTPKMFCQEACRLLGDKNFMVGNTNELIHRMRKGIAKEDVQLLIIDEVQHLKGRRNNRKDVSDLLKNLLNLGIVPIVFVGDETSTEMFDQNIHLANRTGTPLRLAPFTFADKSRHPEFKYFCAQLESEMLASAIVKRKGALSESEGIKLLLKWSGGHIGRVSRVVSVALKQSAMRNAAAVEMEDIQFAIQNFAIPNNYGVRIGLPNG